MALRAKLKNYFIKFSILMALLNLIFIENRAFRLINTDKYKDYLKIINISQYRDYLDKKLAPIGYIGTITFFAATLYNYVKLNKLRTEIKNKIKEREFLHNSKALLVNLEKTYNNFLNFCDQKLNDDKIDQLLQLINQNNIDNFTKTLNDNYSEAVNFYSKLEIFQKLENYQEFIVEIKEYIIQLKKWVPLLSSLINNINQQLTYLNFYNYINDLKKTYKYFEDANQQNIANYIKTTDIKFPYLVLAQKLKESNEKLAQYFLKLNNFPKTNKQKDFINQGLLYSQKLKQLFDYTISDINYSNEQREKPKYEKQKKELEIKLQRELNLSKELDVEIRRETNRLEYLKSKEKEMQLEIMRIKNGEEIKKVCGQLKNEYLQIKSGLEARNQELQNSLEKRHKEIIGLKKSLEDLDEKLKKTDEQALRYYNQLKEKNLVFYPYLSYRSNFS